MEIDDYDINRGFEDEPKIIWYNVSSLRFARFIFRTNQLSNDAHSWCNHKYDTIKINFDK